MEQLLQEELARIQKAAIESLQSQAKQLTIPFSQDIIRAQAAFMSQWNRRLKKLQQWSRQIAAEEAKCERITKAFQECDLWLAPSMMELTDKLVQLYDEGKKQVIPSIIARYYKRNNWTILKKTVSNWKSNSFFRPRMGIIYDALDAHINGKYTPSVPALLPHIEGVAREIVEKYKLPELDKPIIYTKEQYGKDGAKTWPSAVFNRVAINAFSFEELVAIESLLYYLEGTMYLSPRGRGKKLEDFATKDILNRNSILHGRHLKYATSMNSLKCFLALDVLALIDTEEGKQG